MFRGCMHFIHSRPRPASGSFAQDLSASGNYVIARIPVGHNPRGLALSRDGRRLFVANRLDDTISVIDTHRRSVSSQPSRWRGQRPSARCAAASRHSIRPATRSRGRSVAPVATSTPPSTGLNWDLEPDGFGRDIVDNRLLEDLKEQSRTNGTAEIQTFPPSADRARKSTSGARRTYDDLTLTDLVFYIRSLPAKPNRWRLPGDELTPAQERGKAIFERAVDRFGNPIPLKQPLLLLP